MARKAHLAAMSDHDLGSYRERLYRELNSINVEIQLRQHMTDKIEELPDDSFEMRLFRIVTESAGDDPSVGES